MLILQCGVDDLYHITGALTILTLTVEQHNSVVEHKPKCSSKFKGKKISFVFVIQANACYDLRNWLGRLGHSTLF